MELLSLFLLQGRLFGACFLLSSNPTFPSTLKLEQARVILSKVNNLNRVVLASTAGRASLLGCLFASLLLFPSILRHRRVHLIRPCQNSTLQIMDLPESGLPQKINRFRRTLPAPAMCHNLS